ncbi:carboxylesterase family protein [Corynebacterium heidelbergense]|uniref:Carboxylic ester hydrolase n=1 Tax=Corynebacterium heidelbergense TaxID=2055947 RepID=A0A364V4C7_9CORY|nr:carboxylesterase family protein [Corynebacterium heidelbergense]RAV31466.1 hypothetical protein DLJ54_08170 [Corynebacterium heidelbergense]
MTKKYTFRYAHAARGESPTDVTDTQRSNPPAPACPQTGNLSNPQAWPGMVKGLEQTEDCHFLTVTVPEGAAGTATKHTAAKPVLVWVHGGAFVSGAGDSLLFDTSVIAEEQDLVVVTVTYRLGLFGWLGTHANLGLLDVISALRWVNRHIAEFGGDPSNVTVHGESAGADIARALIVADGAEGLFQRVALASWPGGLVEDEDGTRRAMYAAIDRELEKLITPESSTQDLLDYEATVVNIAKKGPFKRPSPMPFGITWGTDPLPTFEEHLEALAAAAPRVDMLVSYNCRELAFAAQQLGFLRRFGANPGTPGATFTRMFIDHVVRKQEMPLSTRPVRELAAAQRRAGGRALCFEITWGQPGNPWRGAHTSELPLLYPTKAMAESSVLLRRRGASGDEVFGDLMSYGRHLRRVWGAFTREGAGADLGELPPAVLKLEPSN